MFKKRCKHRWRHKSSISGSNHPTIYGWKCEKCEKEKRTKKPYIKNVIVVYGF